MNRVPFVDLHAQHVELRAEIDEAIGRAIDSSAFIGGEAVARFERNFADFCNVSHAFGVGDGTHALILALRAVGVMPGDMVLTVSHTFIATAEAIIQCGADPVFIDIDAQTYDLDTGLCGTYHGIEQNRKTIGDAGIAFEAGDALDLKDKLELLLNDPARI